MKNPLNYFFKSKKTMIISFSLVLLFELLSIIITVARPKVYITWITLFNSIIVMIFATIIFLLYWFKKENVGRVFVSITIFLQTAYTLAFSFFSYPKTPDGNYTSFVFYIVFTAISIALFINGMILHTNFNESKNDKTLMSFQIIDIVVCGISFIFVIMLIIWMGLKGYSAEKLCDIFSYISFGCLATFGISSDTIAFFNIDKTNKVETNKKAGH